MVLDSSAGIRLAMHPEALDPATVTFIVPSLFWSETTSAVREATWRDEITVDEGAADPSLARSVVRSRR